MAMLSLSLGTCCEATVKGSTKVVITVTSVTEVLQQPPGHFCTGSYWFPTTKQNIILVTTSTLILKHHGFHVLFCFVFGVFFFIP